MGGAVGGSFIVNGRCVGTAGGTAGGSVELSVKVASLVKIGEDCDL